MASILKELQTREEPDLYIYIYTNQKHIRNSWEYITDSTESTNRRSFYHLSSGRVVRSLSGKYFSITSLSHDKHLEGMQLFYSIKIPNISGKRCQLVLEFNCILVQD